MSSIAIQQFPCCRTLKEFAQAPHSSTLEKTARVAAAAFLAIPALIADLIAYLSCKIHNALIQRPIDESGTLPGVVYNPSLRDLLSAPPLPQVNPEPSAPPLPQVNPEPSAPSLADHDEPPALKLHRDTEFLYPFWMQTKNVIEPRKSLSIQEGIARSVVLYFLDHSQQNQRMPDFIHLAQSLENGKTFQMLMINSRYLTELDRLKLGTALMDSNPSPLRADLKKIYWDITGHARITCQHPSFQAAFRNIH